MEYPLIQAMQKYLHQQQAAPWDDCAVLPRGAGTADQLVTTDMIMDGVHFLSESQPLRAIGHKAMAVNISDIAAMAGTPREAFVSLALPKALATETAIDQLYSGLHGCAAPFEVAIAGGDTNIWRGPLVIAVTLLGDAHPNGAVLRSSAQAGDRIMVTGPLGGSLAGRHLSFSPRVATAQWLADNFAIRGMADISDGLATDLRHIMSLSGVGVTLEGSAIPIHSDVPEGDSRQRANAALTDGEDFELVFCCPPEVAAAIGAATEHRCYEIGACVSAHRDLKVRWDDEELLFAEEGYQHS